MTTPLLTVAAAIGKRTETATYTEGGRRYRATVHYGFDLSFARQHNQAAAFTVTVDVHRSSGGRWVMDACGQQPDLVREHFPHLALFLRWHLVSTDQPMHYAANGTYWYMIAHGRSRWTADAHVDPLDAFADTILLGTAPGDDTFDPKADPLVTFGLDAPRPCEGDNGLGLFVVAGEDGEDRVLDTTAAKKHTNDAITAALEAWLVERFDAMMAAFLTDMQALVALQPEGV